MTMKQRLNVHKHTQGSNDLEHVHADKHTHVHMAKKDHQSSHACKNKDHQRTIYDSPSE